MIEVNAARLNNRPVGSLEQDPAMHEALAAPALVAPGPTSAAGPSRRQRLPAAVRAGQILDAALQAFTEQGYAATRIDDIAARCRLSKGGIYAHFRSKDEIFEALLARSLSPPGARASALPADARVTVDLLIEQVLDPCYQRLADPQALTTLRLMVADGRHLQQHLQRWRQVVLDPYDQALGRLLLQGVAQGSLRPGALIEAPWLLMSPVVQAALWLLVQDGAPAVTLAARRAAHVEMIRALLAP